jgi:hypothetical protein
LAKFLELNPNVPRELAFVDDSPTFDAYMAAGFGMLGDSVPDVKMPKPPGELTFSSELTFSGELTLKLPGSACWETPSLTSRCPSPQVL